MSNINSSQWKRNCPECGKGLAYSTEKILKVSNKNNTKCFSCAHSNISSETRQKMSISHAGERNYLHGKGDLISGIKNPFYGKHHSKERKEIISKQKKELYSDKNNHPSYGKEVSEQTRKKMSDARRDISGENNPNFGKHHSEETKHKQRKARILDLKNKGICIGSDSSRNYNAVACLFIDKLNGCLGLNLQHALNGGEAEFYSYFVDGYDKENNIIFEYDEPHHYSKGKLKHKDIIRQENLVKQIKPSVFIRYNEKSRVLYDAETNQEIPIII